MNPTPYMPKTYHQHYAAFSHLNLPASVQVDSGYIVQFATKQITEKYEHEREIRNISNYIDVHALVIARIQTQSEKIISPSYQIKTTQMTRNNKVD